MERTTADRVKDPIIGRLLDGRYKVGARVARGGMATVYEATDTRLDRTVAIKVMHAGFVEDETFARRFRREAQAAARLAHQNVVAVFDQGDDDGTLFLVMEFVSGITLRDLIREQSPLNPIRVMSLIEPVLSALAAAHRSGMIHRDVKPENVLLAEDGRIKVADFGLARAVNSETQHTGTGVLIGTVSYLSPELVIAGEADARADVYAAGVMIYEMLTGAKPHQADSPIQVAYKHVHEDIPPPSERVPGLPAYVDALVARATARDTGVRPADAGVLLRQVRRVRSALEAGVVDDPELVADLTPHQARLDPFVDTDGQMPRQIIDPSEDTASWSPVEDTGEPVPSEAYAFPQVNNNPADDFPSGDYAPYSATPASPDDVFDQESEQTANLASVGVVPGIAPRQLPPDEQVYAEPEYEDEPDYDDADFGDETPRQRRRPGAAIAGFFRGNGRIRRPWLLPALLVLALVIGLGGWYFGVARYTTTPGVINLSQSDAQAKVRKAGLTFKVKGQGYSETIPAGAVLRTDPQAGSRILKSGSVSAVISRGPERHAVPDVGGLTLDQAQQMLIQSGLTFGKAVESFSRSVPAGKVVRTDPVVKTELRRGAPVDVVVSKGRRPINVPNYTGKPGTDAKKALAKLKFKVTTTQSYSDTVPLGLVIKQTPQGGTLFKGDNVTINISLGPRLYAVPGTVGMGIAAATQTLQAAGFQVATVNSPSYIGLNYVLTQDPVEGTKVPKGTIITLSLV